VTATLYFHMQYKNNYWTWNMQSRTTWTFIREIKRSSSLWARNHVSLRCKFPCNVVCRGTVLFFGTELMLWMLFME